MAQNSRKGERKPKTPTRADILKEEIAAELGLWEKVASGGWGALTARETGRLGGLVSAKLREERK